MRRIGLVVFAACGVLPPDQAPQAPATPDPDLAVVHAWQIGGHLLGAHPTLGDADAASFDGRAIEVSATGFASPWQGTCGEAARSRRRRPLVDVTIENELDGAARAQLISRGFASQVVEYRLTCSDGRAPPLTLVVAGERALTCWGGICYLLSRLPGGR